MCRLWHCSFYLCRETPCLHPLPNHTLTPLWQENLQWRAVTEDVPAGDIGCSWALLDALASYWKLGIKVCPQPQEKGMELLSSRKEETPVQSMAGTCPAPFQGLAGICWLLLRVLLGLGPSRMRLFGSPGLLVAGSRDFFTPHQEAVFDLLSCIFRAWLWMWWLGKTTGSGLAPLHDVTLSLCTGGGTHPICPLARPYPH